MMVTQQKSRTESAFQAWKERVRKAPDGFLRMWMEVHGSDPSAVDSRKLVEAELALREE